MLACYFGEQGEAERHHRGRCTECAKRYRRLSREMALMTRVLRSAPPPKSGVNERHHGALLRIGTALVTALFVFAVGWSYGRSSRPQPAEHLATSTLWELEQPILPRIQDAAASQEGFPDLVLGARGLSSPGMYVAYLNGLGSRASCSGQDFSFSPECF